MSYASHLFIPRDRRNYNNSFNTPWSNTMNIVNKMYLFELFTCPNTCFCLLPNQSLMDTHQEICKLFSLVLKVLTQRLLQEERSKSMLLRMFKSNCQNLEDHHHGIFEMDLKNSNYSSIFEVFHILRIVFKYCKQDIDKHIYL